MCLAIMKKEGIVIPKDTLKRGFYNNNDGAGFSIIETGEKGEAELNIYKGLFEFKDFWEKWEPHQKKFALIHFRVASGYNKSIDGQNCHPHRVTNDLVMAHNGFISGLKDDGDKSDSMRFCEQILKPLVKIDPDFWLMPEFKWFIENSIGYSKIVMMDIKGRYMIFNEKDGTWKDDAWFSNYSYNYSNSWNRQNWDDDDDITGMHQSTDDVIDIETEVVKTTPPSKELSELETEFEPTELAEIDKRLEEMKKSREGAN